TSMPAMILDPQLERELLAQRALTGADRYDEVWEGLTMMSPMANNQHQWLATKLAHIFETQLADDGANIFAGCNVSDRIEGWQDNFRCPDVAVFLAECSAKDCGTHWYGGPNLAVEITSSGDRTREKIEFYERVGIAEFLIIDRHPWQLELFILDDSRHLRSSSKATIDMDCVVSSVTQLEFSLSAHISIRPCLVLKSTKDDQVWQL
ncbi:MAG: Uma2 family endonuclease, partial [Aureliella sp.]